MNHRSVPLLAALVVTICAIVSAAPPPPPDYTTTAPFTPAQRSLPGLTIALDPLTTTGPMFARANDVLLMAAATLRHHLQSAGATVRLTRWDDRPSTHTALGREADEAHRRWLAADSQANLVVRLAHQGLGESDGSQVKVRLFAPATRFDLLARTSDSLTAALDAEIYHERPAHVSISATDDEVFVLEVAPGNLADPEFAAWMAQTGRQRNIARGVFRAIEALNRGALDRSARDTTGVMTAPANLLTGDDVATPLVNLARRLWPFSRPVSSTTEAQWLLDQYKSSVLSDATIFYLSARVEQAGNGWIVKGSANHPHVRGVPAQLLRAAGSPPVRDEVIILPSQNLGQKRFGVTTTAMALTWDKPAEGDGVQTQLLMGDPVMLLDESSDGFYLLVQGHDGYIGWVRSDGIWRLDAEEYAAYLNTPRFVVLRDIKIDDISLPAGASLRPAKPADLGENVALMLPGTEQRQVVVPRSVVRQPGSQSAGETIASAALSRLTVPYVFGGRSGVGLDCSGLTNVACAAAGLVIPRDARQQVLVGQLTAMPWFTSALQPGDLMFFIDETGRVIHTAVSMGGSRFVHASPPEVQVNSLDPTDPLYSEGWSKAFALARRLVY